MQKAQYPKKFAKLLSLAVCMLAGSNIVPAESTPPPSTEKNDVYQRIAFIDGANNEFDSSIPWTKEEKRFISNSLVRLYDRTPGLFKLATTTHTLQLKRVICASLDRSGRSTSAYVRNRTIYFTNNFFTTGREDADLLHELVHAADLGRHIAYSKDWVEMANPVISELRKTIPAFGFEYQAMEKDIRAKNKWPSLYGCTNLTEALAVYFSAFMEDKKFLCSPQFTPIANRLLNPSTSDLSWNEYYEKGEIFMSRGLWSEAISAFQSALNIDESPSAEANIAFCKWRMEDFEGCLTASQKALKGFDDLHIQACEEMKNHLLRIYAECLQHTGNYERSAAPIDEVLSGDPQNITMLILKANFEAETSHPFGESLLALLNALKEESENKASDLERTLDSLIKQDPDICDKLRKGLVLGLATTTGQKRSIYLIMLARISFKSNDFDSCQKYCDDILLDKNKSIFDLEARFLQIRMCEANKEATLAVAKWRELKYHPVFTRYREIVWRRPS